MISNGYLAIANPAAAPFFANQQPTAVPPCIGTRRVERALEPQETRFMLNTFVLSIDARGADGRYMLFVGHCSGLTYQRRRLRWTVANWPMRSSSAKHRGRRRVRREPRAVAVVAHHHPGRRQPTIDSQGPAFLVAASRRPEFTARRSLRISSAGRAQRSASRATAA
jgi:hypothetical protein